MHVDVSIQPHPIHDTPGDASRVELRAWGIASTPHVVSSACRRCYCSAAQRAASLTASSRRAPVHGAAAHGRERQVGATPQCTRIDHLPTDGPRGLSTGCLWTACERRGSRARWRRRRRHPRDCCAPVSPRKPFTVKSARWRRCGRHDLSLRMCTHEAGGTSTR
jgi:hypothetical protein